MEHILRLLARHGVKEIVATLHYLADEIQSYFDDGTDFGVSLHYSIEDSPLGTAGSVKRAQALLNGETFFIVSGDALTSCDLTAALRFHRENSSVATLILSRVQNPLDFGVVITDDENRVVRFLEKPTWSEVFSDSVNTGMYIIEPEVLELMEPDKNYDWSADILPELLRLGKPVFGYISEEYWCDVGSLSKYREANERLLGGDTGIPVEHTGTPGRWVGAGSFIDDNAELIPPVVIGRNCKVKRGARIGPHTVLGDHVIVEEEAAIERSVIWDSCYIGPNVTIQSAVVCNRVTLKRDCFVGEDAAIGDRCLVDVGSTIRPRVKLWPDKIIERGSTVTMSLVWGNKWRGSLFRELGVAGLSNIEITPDFATRLGSAFGSTLSSGSKVITSRDSTRSSRMIKRALIASLVSVGCDVIDLRSSAVPIMRHFVRASGAAGAINVRKLPGNRRVTLIEMFGPNGEYLGKSQERKVETAYFREDFLRADPDDLGAIEFASRAVEEYQHDFHQLLPPFCGGQRLRVVCDYGYSALGPIFPAMLARLGFESISVNGYNDAKLSPRTPEEIADHVSNLREISRSLGFELGALFTDEGERLSLIDGSGEQVEGHRLFGAFCLLVAKTNPGAKIAMSVTAPSLMEALLDAEGASVMRMRSEAKAWEVASGEARPTFGGDEKGGFIFPEFHPGYDAMFALGKLLCMLQETDLSLTDVVNMVPPFHMGYSQVRCPWEKKGSVMRRLAEEHDDAPRELLDGVKIHVGESWALIRPDSVEPIFHVHAESPSSEAVDSVIQQFVQEIERLQLLDSSS